MSPPFNLLIPAGLYWTFSVDGANKCPERNQSTQVSLIKTVTESTNFNRAGKPKHRPTTTGALNSKRHRELSQWTSLLALIIF